MAEIQRRKGGRPQGSQNITTRENQATIEILAKAHTEMALKALAEIAESGKSESARVAAASAIIDRGFGRPRQAIEHTGRDGGPIETALAGLGIADLRSLAAALATFAPGADSAAGGGETTHH